MNLDEFIKRFIEPAALVWAARVEAALQAPNKGHAKPARDVK